MLIEWRQTGAPVLVAQPPLLAWVVSTVKARLVVVLDEFGEDVHDPIPLRPTDEPSLSRSNPFCGPIVTAS